MPNAAQLRHLPLADRSDGVEVRASSGDSGTWEALGGDEKLLQVGDLARASGKTVRAIHLYEEVGLLRPSGRSKGRYRLYDQNALTRLRWIGKLHDLGLSLTQIQEMLHAWETAPSAPDAMAHIRSVYQTKLEETRAQIKNLSALERELSASVAYLDSCQTCDPAELVLACSRCNLHDQSEPELVAGIHNGQNPSVSMRQGASCASCAGDGHTASKSRS